MLKKLFLLAIFVVLSMSSLANDKSEAITLAEKGRDSTASNPDFAKKYFEQAAVYFDQTGPSPEKLNFLEWRALVYSSSGECETANIYFDEAVNTAIQLQEYIRAIDLYSYKIIRCTLIQGGDLEESLKIALKIKEKCKNTDDPELLFYANRLLIDVYWDQEKFESEVLELSIENDELAQEMGKPEQMKHAAFDLAYSYAKMNKYSLALDNYDKVIKIQLAANDHGVSASFNNVANVFVDMEAYDSALYYFSQAEKHAILQKRPDGIAAAHMYTGQVQLLMGQNELALASCQKALKIFQENNIIRRQDMCASCITEAYENLNLKAEAYEAFKFELIIKDSINKLSSGDKLMLVRTEFSHTVSAMQDSLNYAYQHELNQSKIDQQRNRTIYLFIGLGLSLLFGGFILNRFRITRKQKAIIELQKVEVARQHFELQETHKEITDSITYAKRIQNAILPSSSIVKELLGQSFVLYLPKDVVAGDFYWMDRTKSGVVFAAADCTGHGVPGAMVSVVCNNALNRAIKEFGLTDPAKILDKTREIVVSEFQKADKDVKDGMDIALCHLNGNQLMYAGAHNPLWIIRSGEIIETKADKQPIGAFHAAKPFTTHSIELQKGDMVYIFSDGYVDQFGGENGKKLKAKNMREIFLAASEMEMNQQHQYIEEKFRTWKGEYEQIDDVCVIGVKV